jgi:hypothetical protein
MPQALRQATSNTVRLTCLFVEDPPKLGGSYPNRIEATSTALSTNQCIASLNQLRNRKLSVPLRGSKLRVASRREGETHSSTWVYSLSEITLIKIAFSKKLVTFTL